MFKTTEEAVAHAVKEGGRSSFRGVTVRQVFKQYGGGTQEQRFHQGALQWALEIGDLGTALALRSLVQYEDPAADLSASIHATEAFGFPADTTWQQLFDWLDLILRREAA